MKWKRSQPGTYTSGEWTVEGSGTKWTLFYGEEEVGKANSKGELQKTAEEADKAPKEQEPKPKKNPPGKRPKANPEVADLPKVIVSEQGSVSLDGALRSIRLTLDALAHSNNTLAVDLRRVADSNENMASAVRDLIKFMQHPKK